MTFRKGFIFVKVADTNVYYLPERKFNSDLPITTARISGKLYYRRYEGEWRSLIENPYYPDAPLVTPETAIMIDSLPNYTGQY